MARYGRAQEIPGAADSRWNGPAHQGAGPGDAAAATRSAGALRHAARRRFEAAALLEAAARHPGARHAGPDVGAQAGRPGDGGLRAHPQRAAHGQLVRLQPFEPRHRKRVARHRGARHGHRAQAGEHAGLLPGVREPLGEPARADGSVDAVGARRRRGRREDAVPPSRGRLSRRDAAEPGRGARGLPFAGALPGDPRRGARGHLDARGLPAPARVHVRRRGAAASGSTGGWPRSCRQSGTTAEPRRTWPRSRALGTSSLA